MSSLKTARLLKVGAGLAGILVLGFLAALASALWIFRVHTYELSSAPGALSDDTNALRLAEAALRLHGVDSSAYTPRPFFWGDTVARGTLSSNWVSTDWISRRPHARGFGVTLEQHGSNVVCYVTMLK